MLERGMRLANHLGRAALVTADGKGVVDVAEASDFRFGPDLAKVYAQWGDFTSWAIDIDLADAKSLQPEDLQAPSPTPGQVFAVGLNYRAHAEEIGAEIPEHPMIFTKFASCITGPVTQVAVPDSGEFDWEVELVAVIGHEARKVNAEDAWSYIAGLTAGQDLSDRWLQRNCGVPSQWGLGKSHAGYGPTGPWLVTPDELADPDNLHVSCTVNGEVVQESRTDDLIFSVPQLVEYLSSICTLRPGDLIFTGTPAGVAMGRPDQPWLQAGDEVRTTIEGIGELRQRVIA